MKHFDISEFDSPDLPGSGNRMDPHFLQLLDEIRERYGRPIHINSGYRTVKHNNDVGGKQESAHVFGLAADLAAITGEDRYSIVRAAIEVGIKRIGIGKTFVHLDVDASKPISIWSY